MPVGWKVVSVLVIQACHCYKRHLTRARPLGCSSGPKPDRRPNFSPSKNHGPVWMCTDLVFDPNRYLNSSSPFVLTLHVIDDGWIQGAMPEVQAYSLSIHHLLRRGEHDLDACLCCEIQLSQIWALNSCMASLRRKWSFRRCKTWA